MKSIIIEYDLKNNSSDYKDLYDYIKSFNAWAHITESTWFVKTDSSCVDIRNAISKIVEDSDSIFVAELTGVAAWKNVICNSNFLKENL